MTNSRHPWAGSGEETGPPARLVSGKPADPALDDQGVPTSLPVSEWLGLAESGILPDSVPLSRWLLAVLRFSRPDGSPVFGPAGRSPGRLKELAAWAGRTGDPSLAAVLGRWTPSGSTPGQVTSSPPLPSVARPDRPLAVLRPDWSPRGDLAAIDHRRTGDTSLVEIASRGRTWIGPNWTSAPPVGRIGRAVPTSWTSNAYVDSAEWSYRAGRARVTRSVTLVRGRDVVLIGQQTDGGSPHHEMRLSIPDGVEPSTVEGSRAILLSAGKGKPAARLIPLGLPAHDRPTDRGSIAIEGREVVIRQVDDGRRRWLPALLCWGKAPTTWRLATVAHRSKASRPDEAVAARVAWGASDDGLVVYRSLGPAALRSFLGHQTGARFLVGSFDRAGEVRPILKLDPEVIADR